MCTIRYEDLWGMEVNAEINLWGMEENIEINLWGMERFIIFASINS